MVVAVDRRAIQHPRHRDAAEQQGDTSATASDLAPVLSSSPPPPSLQTGTPVTTSVRVGTAVETVGAAGRPKSITGFQTHTTPVLMGVKDRCELGDDAYVPLTTVLEGVVVVKPNPEAGKPVPGAKRPKAAAAGKGASSSSS